jgi:hypothetical protein
VAAERFSRPLAGTPLSQNIDEGIIFQITNFALLNPVSLPSPLRPLTDRCEARGADRRRSRVSRFSFFLGRAME